MELLLLGLLPGTDCRGCGEHGCPAFALLLRERHRPADCLPLFREAGMHNKRQRLKELAEALGLEA